MTTARHVGCGPWHYLLHSDPMADEAAEKINQAVRDCLDRCYLAGDQMSAMTDFLARLRWKPGWTSEEIAHVHWSVLRILREIEYFPSVKQFQDRLPQGEHDQHGRM